MRTSRRRHLLHLLGASAPFAACFRAARPEVNVGMKSGAGQALLAEAIRLHLESAYGAGNVAVRPPLGGTAITHEILLARQIDLYPEYSGVALTAVLGLAPSTDALSVREQVRTNYRIRYRCEWVAPLGFTNPPALVITRQRAERDALANLSEARAAKSPWRLGATREFMARPDCLPLLLGAYKLTLSGAVQVFEPEQLFPALSNGQVTLAAAESLDAGLRTPDFVRLEDDRQAFPPQEAGIVVSLDALDRHPGLLRNLNRLEGRFPLERVARVLGELEEKQASAKEDPDAPPVQIREFAASLLREAELNPAQ